MIKNLISKLKLAIKNSDAILIGAGAGLSTAAGYDYSGLRFYKYFSDFAKKYHISDMYSAGFYPYPTEEEKWAFWSRNIYYNRYDQPKSAVHENLFNLIRDKDYFILTTNVDHLFQNNGFDKKRLFYIQGDYGLWQCKKPCHLKTYDNEDAVRRMIAEQKNLRIPSELIPKCPVCGGKMENNLRVDDTFVEDEGWHAAAERYEKFLAKHKSDKILYWELGVGMNTPGIIKFPFWRMTAQNPNSIFATVNKNEVYVLEEIEPQSICIKGDISKILIDLKNDDEENLRDKT